MTNAGFFHLSIRKILSQYQTGESTPADVAELCIGQYEAFEKDCQAWVCFSKEILRKQAAESSLRIGSHEKIRPLEGIPLGVKDIFNTADFPTQMGSPIWQDFTPGNDARAVFYLKQAGAIIPGKTVTAEFAVHTLGKTYNPHDKSRTPGTSSSGSAVAVATGMVPAAIGTQTAGSIVRPASFCGIYGCKPSFGLIPRTGMLKTTDSLDTIGYFCLHFEDLETIFNVLRVHGSDYPISDAALQNKKRQDKLPGKPWRVALIKTHVWDEAYPYARQAIQDWMNKIGAEDVEIHEPDLPKEMSNAHEIHATIYNKTLSYYFREEFSNDTLISPIMKDLIASGNSITIDEYQQAWQRQVILAHSMDRFFDDYDILISLSTAGEAPPREEVERRDPALMWTMCHLPLISAPVFRSPKGLPFGAQIVARRYNDLKLFRFCKYLRSRNLIPESSFPKVGSGKT